MVPYWFYCTHTSIKLNMQTALSLLLTDAVQVPGVGWGAAGAGVLHGGAQPCLSHMLLFPTLAPITAAAGRHGESLAPLSQLWKF